MILAVAGASLLAACGGPVNPKRPPLYDYEPPKIDGFPSTAKPSRI